MVSAAILIGGRARRFNGRDKSALVISDSAGPGVRGSRSARTILERQLAALAGLSNDIMLVGRTVDRSRPIDVRSVSDRVADRGPLGGLDAALAAARHDRLILLACDMPFVTTGLLAALADGLLGEEGVEAVVPETERGYHPLCAAYARRSQPTVIRLLTENRLKMRDLLRDLRVATLRDTDLARFGNPDRLLSNVNTPLDYASLGAGAVHDA
jgi:molybdopterin-guanine dinucleotide biosynthesis protein A